MASREVSSVTPFLYAFKRGFTFSGRTSALPDILNLRQRYEFFLKYAIGKSLFVLQSAEVKYRIVIHTIEIRLLMIPHRGARAPEQTMAAKRPIFFDLMSLHNRDFPTN